MRFSSLANVPFHHYVCIPEPAEYLPAPMRDRIEVYEREVLSRIDLPRGLLYQEVHARHLTHLVDGEAAVLTRRGDPDGHADCNGPGNRVPATRARERGVKNVSLTPPPHATREIVVTIEEQVMPLLAPTAA